MRIAQYGRDTLVEGLPELLKVLKDVAAIHPFIQGKPAGQGLLSLLLLTHPNLLVAVGAFSVAIELDLKRRENDKKITLLFTEMRDMMAALVE